MKMAITMKTLIAYVFTVLLIISSVHCRMTTTTSPGIGLSLYPHFIIIVLF